MAELEFRTQDTPLDNGRNPLAEQAAIELSGGRGGSRSEFPQPVPFNRQEYKDFLTDNFSKINSGDDETLTELELHKFSQGVESVKDLSMLRYTALNMSVLSRLSANENGYVSSDGVSKHDIAMLGRQEMPNISLSSTMGGVLECGTSVREIGRMPAWSMAVSIGQNVLLPSMKFGPAVALNAVATLGIMGTRGYFEFNRQHSDVEELLQGGEYQWTGK